MDFPPSTSEQVVSLISEGTSTTLTAGSDVFYPVQDMRGYSSYYLVIRAETTGAPFAIQTLAHKLTWRVIGTPVGGSVVVDIEQGQQWSVGNSPNNIQRDLFLSDIVHGTHLELALKNTGAASINYRTELWGSTRVVDGPHVSNGIGTLAAPPGQGSDDILYQNSGLAVATTGTDIYLPPYYGRVHIHAEAYTNPIQFTYGWGSDTPVNLFSLTTIPVNGTFELEWVLGRVPMFIHLIAQGGAAIGRLHIITMRDKT